MAIVRPSASADDYTDTDRQSVDPARHSTVVRTIPGSLVRPDGPDEDDIAPGLIEYYTPRPSKLARTGSAAVVAAIYTGRSVGVTARHSWKLTRWFGHGVRSATFLGYRYVRAHDHQEVIGGRKNGTDWNKVERTKRDRWKLLAKLAAAIGLVDLASWWALVDFAHLTALGGSYAVAPGVETVAAVAGLTLYGRYRLANQLAPEQIVAPDDVDDGEEPFPLAYCRTGQEVAECVGRALAYEGVGTRQINVTGAYKWGWEVEVTLKGSTPGKVNAICDQMDAHLDLQRGGTLVEPDPRRSAHLTLRLVQSDPFADMAIPQVHAPNSLSVKDLVGYGQCMDGSQFELRLRGMSMLLIGSTGSAKTKGAIRSLLEAITACRDAIALEMDPVKDGSTEFQGILAAPPIRGPEACTRWTSWLVKLATARAAVKSRRNMGDLWQPSREHPSVFVVMDEFIYMPNEAKANAIALLRIGREVGIHIIFAAQEGTEDALGDAVANAVPYRAMLASRSEDIRLALGTGAAAAGYRPDRLVPAVDDERVYDAGKFYIRGPGFLRPIQYRWHRLSREQIQEAVKERMAAGRPWFDDDSLAEAKLLDVLAEFRPDGRQLTVVDRLERMRTPDAATVAGLLRQFDRFKSAFLPTEVLVAAGLAADGVELQKLLARLVPTAKSTKETVEGRQQRGWTRAVVEQAAAALFAPS